MRSTQLLVKDIIKEVAEEMGQPFSVVEDVFYHQFEFLKDFMEHGDQKEFSTYENVLLKHLGTFYASERVMKAIDYAKSRNKQCTCDSTEVEECNDCESESTKQSEPEED